MEKEEGSPLRVDYSVDESLLSRKRMFYGVYVIGTTLDKKEYSMDRVFSIFKEQYTVENANKVLKGPVKLRPIFLHKQERIESLILVIFFALMVYYLLERSYYYHQREEEKRREKKGKRAIKKVTAKSIFWMFSWYNLGIIDIEGQKIVKPAELSEEQQEIFDILRLPHPKTWLIMSP